MARCARASLAFACVLACGPDAASPIALDEVCGGDGPFRVLPLGENERLIGVRRIGDRSYYSLETLVDSHEAEPTTRLVATGPCGESPTEIARDVFQPFEHERWPGHVLGCSAPDGGAMLVLDPAGIDPPRTAMAAPACRGTPNEHGIVGVIEREDASRSLALVPWPADLDGPATEAIVLVEAIRGEPFQPDYAVRGADVFTVDTDHDLLRVALPSGATSLEQSQVGAWGVTTDARVLAWRDFDPLEDPSAFAPGVLHLRDRSDGRTADLDDVSLHSLPPISTSTWFGTKLAIDDTVHTRFVELPSFATLDVPGDLRIVDQLLDGRLLITKGARGPLAILEPSGGTITSLADIVGDLQGGPFDHVDVFAAPTSAADEAAVWRVPFDASPAVQLAERASREWFELDGAVVTPLDVDENGIGDLVQIDPDTLDARTIDDHVVAKLQGRGEHATFDAHDVVYSVVDGDRSGIWVARLAARE